ncbi:CLUMA_CG013810, isoform A [Clunio marinus]|uniref:CLUMA_CG013810, isoform A n=1 Tax=Clunio marinus TaxID=568069 RepID=A0A1J1IJX3_9DIPT|nr:CLUMA_CG013810, isoform A [Clunio marinus]
MSLPTSLFFYQQNNSKPLRGRDNNLDPMVVTPMRSMEKESLLVHLLMKKLEEAKNKKASQ